MQLTWRQIAPGPGPSILTSVTEAESAELAKLAAGRDVLEVGSANGYSAVLMALAGAASLTAIDDHNGQTWLGDTHATMQANLGFYGLAAGVDIVKANSRVAMPEFVAGGNQFGLIFIDGDHTFEGARADIADALRLVEPGGVIAVHDYGEVSCPGVGQALDQMFPGGPSRLIDTLFVVET